MGATCPNRDPLKVKGAASLPFVATSGIAPEGVAKDPVYDRVRGV